MAGYVARHSRHRRGISAVQAALVMPLLFLLTFALLEYGWMFVRQHQISHAARHGARVGARDNSTALQARQAASQYLTNVGITHQLSHIVCAPANLQTLATGQNLTITITIPYPNLGLNLPLMPKPTTLKGRAVMAREGP